MCVVALRIKVEIKEMDVKRKEEMGGSYKGFNTLLKCREVV